MADIFPDKQQAALARAACVNDGDQVKQLVAAGAKPNEVGGEGVMGGLTYQITPLFWAMDCDATEGVEALLAAGADPNMPVDSGRTAVMFAAADDNPSLLRAILDHGGAPNAHDSRDSALILAWQQQGGMRSVDKLPEEQVRANWEALLAAGADVNLDIGGNSRFSGTAAGKAALMGDWPIVLELLNLGYAGNPDELAADAQQTAVWPDAKRQAAKKQVIGILRERGELLPLGPIGKDLDPDIGWIDYRASNGKLAKAGVGPIIQIAVGGCGGGEEKPPFNGKRFQLLFLVDDQQFLEASNSLEIPKEMTPADVSSRWGLNADQVAEIRKSPSTWEHLCLP